MRVRAFLVWAVLLAASRTVFAQDGAAEYPELIADAVQEFDAARYAEARALFRRAHAISPNARTLRGIGLCSFEMSDYVEAFRALSAALEERERALSDEQRAEVEGVLRRTGRFVGFYRVATTPSTVSLAVDGAPAVTASDGRVILAMGSHEIVARAEGHRDAHRTVRVEGGEDTQLELGLEAVASAAPIEMHEDTPPAATNAASDPVPGIVALSLGGAAIIGSVISGAVWWPDRETEIGRCMPPACDNPDVLRTERDASIGVTIVLAIGGAAALVAGTVLLVSALVPSSPSAALACSAEGSSLRCRF